MIRQLLYNKGIRKAPIGHSDMVCTYTGNRSRQCNGTYFLPRGKISVAGSVRYWEFFKLAIVGGTDLYADAGARRQRRFTPATRARAPHLPAEL